MSRSGERGVGVDGDNSVRKVRRRFDASLNPTISRPIATRNVTTNRQPVTRPKLDATAASISLPSLSKIARGRESDVVSASTFKPASGRWANFKL